MNALYIYTGAGKRLTLDNKISNYRSEDTFIAGNKEIKGYHSRPMPGFNVGEGGARGGGLRGGCRFSRLFMVINS